MLLIAPNTYTPPIVEVTDFPCRCRDKHPSIASIMVYLPYEGICSCMHIMSMLWSIIDAVSSGSWLILLKVLTLNVAICIVLLHFSKFCFSWSSVADFLNTGAKAQTSVGHAPFLPTWRVMRFEYVVWVGVIKIFQWLCFILIHKSHPKRWAAVVPQLNYLILAIVPWDCPPSTWLGVSLTHYWVCPPLCPLRCYSWLPKYILEKKKIYIYIYIYPFPSTLCMY